MYVECELSSFFMFFVNNISKTYLIFVWVKVFCSIHLFGWFLSGC